MASSIEEEVTYNLEKSTERKSIFKSLINYITLEPLVLFYFLPSTINHLITQNLFLDKSCRMILSFNITICEALMEKGNNAYPKEKLQVHQLTSQMITIKTFINGLIPVILMLFIGSWSDKHKKRKACILVPIIGELIAVLCLILNTIYLYDIPIILISLAYSLPTALSGGWPCLLLGVYTYVSTGTTQDSLTTKIGGVATIQNIAIIIGLALSGIIFHLFGFIGAYSTTFFMILSSFVYGYYIIKDRNTIVEDLEEEIEEIPKTIKELTKDIFHIQHFLTTFKFFFKHGEKNRRFRMIALIALLMIINGPLQGEQSIFYLYTKFTFNWNEIDFATFYAIQFLLQILGSAFAIVFLSKYLKWKDESLGILALFGSISGYLNYAFANNTFTFYIGAILDLFNATTNIALRSLMSKLVTLDELGRSNSIFGICEALTHLIFGTLYTILYEYSIDFMPGMVFIVSSFLKFIGIILFLWLYNQTDKHEKTEDKINRLENF